MTRKMLHKTFSLHVFFVLLTLRLISIICAVLCSVLRHAILLYTIRAEITNKAGRAKISAEIIYNNVNLLISVEIMIK